MPTFQTMESVFHTTRDTKTFFLFSPTSGQNLLQHADTIHSLPARKSSKSLILRFLILFFRKKNTENRFWDVLNRPMVVISTRGINTMYEECVCEFFFQIKIFFISKTFFEFTGTSQKWVKNRLPQKSKKV